MKRITAIKSASILLVLILCVGITVPVMAEDAPRSDLVITKNPFSDVSWLDHYFYDAVQWASENDIAPNSADGLFNPNLACTRAQFISLLWREQGMPEPALTETCFSDVKKGAYYYEALLWACEQGIAVGTTAATFSPDDFCIRAQAIAFIWRVEGKPESFAVTAFSDLANDAYYYDAVCWALGMDITTGTAGTTFSPDENCSRAQAVEFLYRLYINGEGHIIRPVEIKSISVQAASGILNKEDALRLTDNQIGKMKELFSNAKIMGRLYPPHLLAQTSDPQYVIYIDYTDGQEDTLYSCESDPQFFYRYTGTYGDNGDPGFTTASNADFAVFFEGLGLKSST